MKKFFLYLYLAFLIMFIFNWMNRPEPEEVIPPAVEFGTLAKDKYVLPKTPVFLVKNNTEQAIKINNCEHIEIRQNGAKRPLPEELCQDIEVAPSSQEHVLGHTDAWIDLFQKLGNVWLEFTFVYQQGDIDIKVSRDIVFKKPGTFRSFFRTVFYQPIYNFFVLLIELSPSHSLGIAIIVITLIIRVILLVPQQRIMISQGKMQAIQPKVKAIQEKYKNDQAQLGMRIMELYRKEKVNPFGAFVPLFIQIPILIVLYWTILGINDIANHYHLYRFDILQSFKDTVIQPMFLNMDLLASGGMVGLILAITVGVAQFIQMKLAHMANKKKQPEPPKPKKKPKKDGEPEMPDMQKISQIMIYFLPVMVAFFTYQFPAGVGLYWLVGTIFMTFQQLFVNKLLVKDQEKPKILDKDGKVVS